MPRLKEYIDLQALLADSIATHEENRAFGLKHTSDILSPVQQLSAWIGAHKSKLKKPLLSETLSSYLYGITLTLVIIAFVLGLLSGVGLLSYSGHAPVNIVYFIAIAVFLPLLTMALTLLSMMRASSAQSMLVHISPAFWMEKIWHFFFHKMTAEIRDLKINPLLANRVVIKRSQVIALAFSFGLLFALLGMVATQDIAFTWSTTLDVSTEEFHAFLHALAFPWYDLLPWAFPSIELIEQSQYFRLGGKLSDEMIHNASRLGEWWKFLACATLFYAIILRFFVYALSQFLLSRAIKRSFCSLEGVTQLLHEMNAPIISTHARETEALSDQEQSAYPQTIAKLEVSYDMVLGWAIPSDQLSVMSDTMNVTTSQHSEVGGGNTLEKDSEIIAMSRGQVLLFVKAWEPPTMDFVDFLELLSGQVDRVVVCPVGTAEKSYEANEREVSVWGRKLALCGLKNVWLKQ